MSKKPISKVSPEDRDEAPILDSHFFATGAVKAGELTLREASDTMARRGRPPKGKSAKVQQSLRLSPEVLEHFRSTGPGWQARIDDTLRRVTEQQKAFLGAGESPAAAPAEPRIRRDIEHANELIAGSPPAPAKDSPEGERKGRKPRKGSAGSTA
jgi:uncharacterized protein (DUF4415 family)